jgi:hypothetical protein
MFRDASKFNQPIGGWNVARVVDMAMMFSNAATFGQNVAALNVRRVASLNGAFNSSPISVSPCAVYNAWGATLEATYPTWRAPCLCGKVELHLGMTANAATGANSNLTAQLSAAPTDANVSLSAMPQKGAVNVPLVTHSSGLRGSADLPSTGTWDVQLIIDGQSCPSQPTGSASARQAPRTSVASASASKASVTRLSRRFPSPQAGETGANAILQVSVSSDLPANTAVELFAVPQNATVKAPSFRPASPISVVLPSTGNWSVTVRIGSEQCTRISPTLIVECLSDERGRGHSKSHV